MGAQSQQGSSPQQTVQMLMRQMAGAQNPQLGQLFSQMVGGPVQMPPEAQAFFQQQGPMQAMPQQQQFQMLGNGARYANQPQQRQSAKAPGAGSSGPSTAGFGTQGGAGSPPPGLASALGQFGGPQPANVTRQMSGQRRAASQSQPQWQR